MRRANTRVRDGQRAGLRKRVEEGKGRACGVWGKGRAGEGQRGGLWKGLGRAGLREV